MNPDRLKGLGFFGLFAASYAYYPYVVLHFGHTLATLLMAGSSFGGIHMFRMNQTCINTIEMILEGEHSGKLKMNVSDSLVTSRDIIVSVSNVHSMISLSNDDMGEDDAENDFI